MDSETNAPAEDTSRISITALHTGYTWYANNLSHEVFATKRGKMLYHSARPWMLLGNAVLGLSDLETSLLQRHILIDHLLEKAIRESGVKQVLELACGLSPRGFRFKQKLGFDDLLYVEADLPDMARRKKALLEKAGLLGDNHRVIPVNILEERGAMSLEGLAKEHLDPNVPTAVITEGIINYFDRETMTPLWGGIAKILGDFSGGVYISDNMPHQKRHIFYPVLRTWNWIVAALAQGRMHMHFNSDQETEEFFTEMDFRQAKVHSPEEYFGTLPIPESRLPSFLKIIEAKI